MDTDFATGHLVQRFIPGLMEFYRSLACFVWTQEFEFEYNKRERSCSYTRGKATAQIHTFFKNYKRICIPSVHLPILCPTCLSLSSLHSVQVDDSVEALDAAAVEAALSLCEEAVSEGHTLPGPWDTQELKASDPAPAVQDPDPMQEPQDAPVTSVSMPAGLETQTQPDVKREEQTKGNCEATEVTGSDVTSSVASDDGANGSEVTEEGAAGKEAAERTVKSEAEEWNQPEPNPPCLGGWHGKVYTHSHTHTEIMCMLSNPPLLSVPQTLRTALYQGKRSR